MNTTRNATRMVAVCLGLVAAIAGFEHGYFEVLQGNTRPEGVMIVSIGPPCLPAEAWNACEPAMTIWPDFLVTGILAMMLSVCVLACTLGFVQRRYGGWLLILLSVALLLFGGGFFPPLIGIMAGAGGTQINRPLPTRPAGRLLRFVARWWPWPLLIFTVWTLGQIPLGYFFNDFLQRIMVFGLILILTTMPLSLYVGYAHDVAGSSS